MILDVVDQWIMLALLYNPALRIILYCLIVGLTLYSIATFMFGRNYLKARFLKSFGREMGCEVDLDNSQEWVSPKKKVGTLILPDRAYDIAGHSVIRGADCDFYLLNKPLGRTLTPEVITAANNLKQMGYKNFSHAFLTYQVEKHPEDYKNIVEKAIENKTDIKEALKEFDKKVYTSLMKPDNTDQLTKNIAILYQWSNQKLSAYGNKQIIEEVRQETERENKKQGVSLEKLLGYAVVVAIVFLAGAIAYQMIANSGGGGGAAATTLATTTTTLI